MSTSQEAMIPGHIYKRDGSKVAFDPLRIQRALAAAGSASGEFDAAQAERLTEALLARVQGQRVLDVEQVQGAQQKMISEKEAMLNELGTLTNQINSIIGSAWQGNSATEFQQAYEQLRNQLNQQLTALGELATALQTEITQWQEVASRMG